MSSHAFKCNVRIYFAIAFLSIVCAIAIGMSSNSETTFRELPTPRKVKARPETLPVASGRMGQSFQRVPIHFEAYAGQADEQVKFVSRGRGYSMFLTGTELILALRAPDQKAKGKGQMAKVPVLAKPFQPSLLAVPDSLVRNSNPVIQNPPTPDIQYPAPEVLRMKLVGANARARVTGADPLPGKSNYFIGNDPRKWRTNVSNYARVKYQGIYPGMDLVYYGTEGGQLEYDFVVAPGADPHAIAFEIVGPRLASARPTQGSALRIAAGDLVIATDSGDIRFHKPIVYQPVEASLPRHRTVDGVKPPLEVNPESPIPSRESRQFVDGRFVLAGNRVGFDVPSYDKSLPLVIDPVLTMSTLFGGGTFGNGAQAIDVDQQGYVYIGGISDYGALPAAGGGVVDGYGAYVSKLDTQSASVVYSTFIGARSALGIAVDNLGRAYVTGEAASDLPTTSNAFNVTCGSDQCPYLVQLSPAGDELLYSGFVGLGIGRAIAVDSQHNAYIAGQAYAGFPVSPGAVQSTFGGYVDAFVAKINPAVAGTGSLVYATYLGGGGDEIGWAVGVDSAGEAYVAGRTPSSDFPTTPNAYQSIPGGSYDAFVSKVNATGTAFVYSSRLGGSNTDEVLSLAVDGDGDAIVAGYTSSSNFPVTPDAYDSTCGSDALCNNSDPSGSVTDAFVTKLNATGTSLVFSTFLGGESYDYAYGVDIDSTNHVYVTGWTNSDQFPTYKPIKNFHSQGGGGNSDAFVTKIAPDGQSVVYSTYFGYEDPDVGNAIRADNDGNAILAGSTYAFGLPLVRPVQQSPRCCGYVIAGFLAMIGPADAPAMGLTQWELNFGQQSVGTTSNAQTVTIKNPGSAPLTIQNIGSSIDFNQTNDCGTSLAEGGGDSCTVSVTFQPTAAGTETGKITFIDNASGSPHTVSLNGIGTGSSISLSTRRLDFSPQLSGTASPAQTLRISNLATVPLNFFTEITISGAQLADFSQVGNCSTSLGPNSTCSVQVTFAPVGVGVRKAVLEITDSASGSPHIVALSGVGTDFATGVQPGEATSATVSAGSTATYNLQLAPTGFAGDVELSCGFEGSTPRGANCSVSPTAVTLNGSDPAPIKVNVTTTARASALPPVGDHHSPLQPNLWVMLLACFGLSCIALSQLSAPVRSPSLRWTLIAATLFVVLLWAACGGGGGGGGTTPQVGTPAGNYNLTLSATAGGVTKTTTLTLKVN